MEYVPPLGGGANDPYVDGDPQTGTKGSVVPAAAIEDVMREVVNVITAAGLTPSDADLTQLSQAIAALNGNPSSSTHKAVARFNGTDGGIQDSENGPFATDGGGLSTHASNGALIGGPLGAGNAPPNDDLDDATGVGWYAADNSANRPTSELYQVLTFGTSSDKHQLAFSGGGNDFVYYRQTTSGVWGSWIPLLSAKGGADLTGGFTSTSLSKGTVSSGTFTPVFFERGIQHITNGGAFTLDPPTGHGTMILDIVNNASAGAITTSNWDLVDGDPFDTTDNSKFRCYISVGDVGSHLNVRKFS
ncbi:MAG: pyocin knob domain-containing protein [Alphaproteobacteria bacterium]